MSAKYAKSQLTEILNSKTSIGSTSDVMRTKAASSPVMQKPGTALKVQISAPGYLLSLTTPEAPPFRKPQREPRPRLLIGTIVTEDDVVDMIAAADGEGGLESNLGRFIIAKEIIANYNVSEKGFLVSFLVESIDYAAQRDFNKRKLACLLTIYLATHMYFKWYYWAPPAAVWGYFKELMIMHTVEDSPDGEEVFEPEECYDIVSHFHTAYLTNLPLVHLRTFGVYKLKYIWPFTPSKK